MKESRIVERALSAAGLKTDVAADRVLRAVTEVAEAAGVAAERVVERPALLADVLDRLTIQESWFFRDPHQMEAVARQLLPALALPVSVWCAGCANGQEAWTMAMVLTDAGVEDWRITATDLSSRAVAAAREGVYGATQLRGLPALQRARYFNDAGDGRWSVDDRLRARVEILQHNVARQAPPVPLGSCDIVLCRNVLIYLSDDAVQGALGAVEDALAPGGTLLVGGAESLWGLTDRFETVRLPDAFAYRKATPAEDEADAAPTRRSRGTESPMPSPADLVRRGRASAAAGDHEAAATAFRQAVYLDPDEADAHAGLSDALEALGHARSAARARAAGRLARRRSRRERRA